MRRFLFGIVASAAILAAASGMASAADQYPPCKSRSDDHCIQSGAMMHKEGTMKRVEHKAKQMGHKAAAKGHAMKMKMEPAAKTTGSGAIPQGCSPATTPCQ